MSLPTLPSGWASANSEGFVAHSAFSSPVKRQIEPVGPGFLAHARRTLRGRTWSEDEKEEAAKNVKQVEGEDEDADLGDEPEDIEDLEREAKDWKSQDHYRVLGISHLRHRATEDQIRRAHRKRVLKHHPDKKAASGSKLDEDDFFKCIQKAFEVLMDSNRRRQYDSVDEAANVEQPTKKTTTPENFIELWGPFFDSEIRFSKTQPCPSLGNMESSKADVEGFYAAMYSFDSWRTFEYLDEDVPDDSSNRDHKRYIEKKNKAQRQKHKTEDTARFREAVDLALSLDPRIKMFKDAEKKAKEAKKWEKEAGAREAAAKAAKEAEEAAAKAKKDAEEAAANKENAKKNKEAAKSAKKKNKRAVRNAAKDNGYFGDEAKSADIDLDLDALLNRIDDLALGDLAAALDGADAAKAKTTLTEAAAKAGGDYSYFA
ncbi:Zuotin [Yarrowia sp. B02]|nr:Zuotin [Yarrowia sp. B02]